MEPVKALIVEDEQIVAIDLKRRLSKLDYDVIGLAANAEKVLKIIQQTIPDIILMDIHIQGKTDGIELSRIIHKKYDIPIIYLTAYSEEKTLKRARDTKPYGYILKPFSERELDISIQVAIERFNADKKLRKNEEHLNMALEAASLGTWELDQTKDDVFIGKCPDGLVKPLMNWQQMLNATIDSDKEKVTDTILILKNNQYSHREIEFRIKDKNAQQRWLKLYGTSFESDKQGQARVVGVLQDITERHEVESQLTQAATVFKCTAEGIAILDANRKIDNINEAFVSILGFQESALKGRDLPFLMPQTIGETEYKNLWLKTFREGTWQGEVKAYKQDGCSVNLLVNIGTVPSSEKVDSKFVVVISDISALREAQDKLTHIAYFDSLTELPNRSLLLDRFEQAIIKAARDKRMIGVLFIDLDHFKRVNDSMGHQVGDNLLRTIGRRLSSRLRKSDTIGRIGGDEFIVLLENIEKKEDAETTARNLLKVMTEPVMLNKTEVTPSGSIGISLYPNHSTDRSTLIQMADTAMYAAKRQGRNCSAFYHKEMTTHTIRYLVRDRELRNALKNSEFELHYQPIFSAETGAIESMEALIRWNHPDKGLVTAGEVIPFAESSSLIIEIGRWILKESCRQIREWLDQQINPPCVGVNVSVKQFTNDDLPYFISQLLYEYRIPPHLLSLEITESCLQKEEQVLTSLRQFGKMGIKIALDDFGTGYSCLSSLKLLPIDFLKIDQSFIADIPNDKDDCAIALAIIAMSHQLNKKVIAEGIEKQSQLDFLKQVDCDLVQGFHLAKPVSADNITELLCDGKKLKRYGK